MGGSKSKVHKKRDLKNRTVGYGDLRDPETGRFAKGNPGRPEGALNKFTRIKNILADIFLDKIDGEKMTIEFAKSGKRNFARFLDHIVALSGKQNGESNRPAVINIIYGYRRAGSSDSSLRSKSRNKTDQPS